MAGRYLISGGQIGVLIGLLDCAAEMKMDNKKAIDLLNEIQEKQFLGNSNVLLSKDVKKMQLQ